MQPPKKVKQTDLPDIDRQEAMRRLVQMVAAVRAGQVTGKDEAARIALLSGVQAIAVLLQDLEERVADLEASR